MKEDLNIPIRSAGQLGNALLRFRRQANATQAAIGSRAGVKQGAISTLERGASGVRLGTLFRVLAALDLELVVRRRKKGTDGPTS